MPDPLPDPLRELSDRIGTQAAMIHGLTIRLNGLCQAFDYLTQQLQTGLPMTSDILAILDARIAFAAHSGITALPLTPDELRAFKVGTGDGSLDDAHYQGFTLYADGVDVEPAPSLGSGLASVPVVAQPFPADDHA